MSKVERSDARAPPESSEKCGGGSRGRRVNNLTPRRINVFLRGNYERGARFARCDEAAPRTATGSIIIGFARRAAREPYA